MRFVAMKELGIVTLCTAQPIKSKNEMVAL
jgi:hypothetical protein